VAHNSQWHVCLSTHRWTSAALRAHRPPRSHTASKCSSSTLQYSHSSESTQTTTIPHRIKMFFFNPAIFTRLLIYKQTIHTVFQKKFTLVIFTITLANVDQFLLLARYVPNVAKGSIWDQCKKKYILRTDRRPATSDQRPTEDRRPTYQRPHIWKISNGHISARGLPIHLMFGSSTGFFGSADRMHLFPVSPNPRFILKNSNNDISAADRPIYFVFGSRMGFSRSADRMALFPVSPNPRWRLRPHLENFKWRYLRSGSSDLLRVWF